MISDFSPNTHQLLRILCTLPITSAECERSFSALRRLNMLKTSLRATMSSEQESSLALTNIHYDQDIDVDAVIEIFAQTHPRRLLLADLLSAD